MADRYFKKDRNKFNVGYTDVVFKYDPNNHDIESLEARFTECDKNGKNVTKKTTKTTAKKGAK